MIEVLQTKAKEFDPQVDFHQTSGLSRADLTLLIFYCGVVVLLAGLGVYLWKDRPGYDLRIAMRCLLLPGTLTGPAAWWFHRRNSWNSQQKARAKGWVLAGIMTCALALVIAIVLPDVVRLILVHRR